jgi:WD40 repeat protein
VTASEDHTARIWDAKTGQPIGQPLHHDDKVFAASFSPDGTRIVTASSDYTAGIWDGESGNPIGEPLHHNDEVFDVSFSPDGTRIVTASSDNSAHIWDIKVDFEAPLPGWFPVLLEALGGKRLNEQGALVDAEQGLLEQKQLLALKGEDYWSRLGRWFATPGPERTISPNSTVTVQEWEDNQHKGTALQ